MKNKRNVATIEDVAALAGVSHATVGRIVGGYGKVSEKTREKVKSAIDQLGYSPNAIAQSLRSRQTRTLAVVVGSIANNFFSRVISAVEDEITRQGYNLIICSTHEDPRMEIHLLQELHKRRTDAIILASIQDQVPGEQLPFYTSEIPLIFIDHGFSDMGCDLIETANQTATREAAEYLIALGHKRIGVLATTQFPTVRKRLAGYREALERHGISYDPGLVIERKTRADSNGCDMIQELLLLNEDVTAVLILNNSLCENVLLELRRLKKKIPDDLSLITWDDTSLNELLGITSIVQFPELMGKAAAAQAIRRIQENLDSSVPKSAPFVKSLDAKLQIRSSCRTL